MATVARLMSHCTTNSSPQTTPAFTPAAGDLLVVVHVGDGTSGEPNPTIASTGFVPTWTRIPTAVWVSTTASNNGRGVAWVADSLATATSTTITINWPLDGSTGNSIYVFAISGMTKTGAAAIKQYVAKPDTVAGTPTMTFPAACLTSNPVIVYVHDEGTAVGQTPPAGFTELDENIYTVPTVRTECAAANSGITASTITWGVASTGNYNAFGVELDASGGAAATLPPKALIGNAAVDRSYSY
jgi:hypothetical protein